MSGFDRIQISPDVLNGQPCIRDTRIPVRRLVLALAHHGTLAEVRKDFPAVTDEDIRQALEYAAASIEDQASLPAAS